jgi:hypothetical protein
LYLLHVLKVELIVLIFLASLQVLHPEKSHCQ